MKISNIKMPLLFLICLFLSLLNGYGQDILPKEQEREIKTSGKYYYSECSAFDEADAKECALRDLTQIVIIDMVKQTIKSNEAEVKNAMEMRAQTAKLNLTGRIRILAWIEKDHVQPDTIPIQTSEPAKIPAQTPAPETIPVPIQQLSPPAGPEPAHPEPAHKSDISLIADPVVRDLATSETFDQFRRMADKFRRQGKIVYGTNKASFVYPENCFVAVFTTEQKLIALLDTGKNSRIDFLTGKTVQNIEQQFTGNILYWIQTIN